jgi:hypothetical protein
VSATDTKKVPTLSRKASQAFTATMQAELSKLAGAVEEKGTEFRTACFAFGKYALDAVAKMVAAGGNEEAAQLKLAVFLSRERKRPYVWETIARYGKAESVYSSLTPKSREKLDSMDVFVKLAAIEETSEEHGSRQTFVDSMIEAGITSEADVRKAVTAERKARKGEPQNEIQKIREQAGKVSKAAGPETKKLKALKGKPEAAAVFLAGAKWGIAFAIATLPRMEVQAYRDGLDEAFHGLLTQTAATPQAKAPAKAK